VTPRVRFLRAELAYGCHPEGEFALPADDEPVVIAGPNGAGKTTLLEALVRTLFGFNRRSEGGHLESRAPWEGDACRAAVELEGGDGRRYRIRRDFADGRVEIESLDGGETWSGDGNPGASNQEAREYRARLAGIFGLSEIDHYERTASIVQGRLLRTELGEDLLRIAGGGHADVEDARARIEDAHDRLTVRPIEEGRTRKRKERELEEIDARIDRIHEELRRAEAAFARRTPLQDDLAEAREAMDRLDESIGRLERALAPLRERQAIEARKETLTGRRDRLDRARRRLRDAEAEFRRALDDAARRGDERYPDDFPARTGRIEGLWERTAELEAERQRARESPEFGAAPPVWPAVLAAAGGALAGAALWLLADAAFPAAVLALLGLAAGYALESRRRVVLSRRRDRHDQVRGIEDELADVRRRLERELEGVPRAATLSPETIDERKREFEARRESAGRVRSAGETLETAIAEAREAFEDAAKRDPVAEPDPGDASRRAGATLEACENEIERLRTELAKEELLLRQIDAVELPEGVDPAPEAVERALKEQRREKRALDEKIRDLERRIDEESTGLESPVALRDRLTTLEARRAEVDRETRTLEAAYTLLRDAYDAFRAGDQARLVGVVSDALSDLTGGAIGPVEAPDGLAHARVRVRGRSAPLASPPLSYGEYHAALFAIRLGAADFLARGGIRPPLVVDEPFAYLDLGRARSLWATLRRIAAERQVIVATQETLTLDALGVAPDLALEAIAPARTAP